MSGPEHTCQNAWLADGKAIGGATGARLTLAPAQAGHQVTVTVTASLNGYEPVHETSDPTHKVAKG